VAGAYVSVSDPTGSGAGYAVTDATGAFEIGDLAPGDYKVSFAADTMWQWWHQQRDEATADLVTVVSEADTRLEEQTLPTGSLEVTVADSVTGQPIPGACVDAFPAGGGCSDSGVVTFTDVVVGTYQLSASADVLHFFGDGVATVTAGTTSAATVLLDPAAAISLRATDAATGAAVSEVCVHAARVTSPGLPLYRSGDCTDAAGRVTVGRLRAGDYRILAVPGDARHGLQWVGEAGGTGIQERAATVHAPVGLVTDAPTARLDPPGSIAGRVIDAATRAPVADICTVPYAASSGDGPGSGPQCSAADGRFVLSGLGPYRWPVEFVDFSGQYAWQWSGRAVHRQDARPIGVRAGRTSEANAALSAGGRITGRFSGPDGQPQYGTAFAYNTVSGDFAAAYGPSDDTGEYAIQGLAAQQVIVEGRPAGPGPSVWYQDAADAAHATPVTVPAGGTVAGIDLRLPG